MPVRFVKVKADQPDPAQVRMAAAAISEGQLVVLPTETVYGFAAVPGDPASVQRLQQAKGRAVEHAFTHHVASAAHATALARAPLPDNARRLIERYWPGPLTIVVEGKGQSTVGLRVPAHGFTQQVLAQFEHGLLLSSVNATGEPPLITPEEIARRFPEIDLLIDGGPPPLAQASAVVRCGPRDIEVLREGTLDREQLLRVAAATVLFVCTGNTCRSPLAAALARRRAAEQLGVAEDELPRRGLRIASAGTMVSVAMPATEGAIAAAAEVGLDLSGHRSRPVAAELPASVVAVYALARSHLEALLRNHPQLGAVADLLDPDGCDIPDPFGGELALYRETRDAIGAALERRWAAIAGWM